RRAPDGLPDERVHFPDEPHDLTPSAPPGEHVSHELGDHPPLLPRLELGPCAPRLLDLQVDADLQEERDRRLPVPAELPDPRVVRVLEHLVDRAGLPPEEPEVRGGPENASLDSVLEDRAVEPPHLPE